MEYYSCAEMLHQIIYDDRVSTPAGVAEWYARSFGIVTGTRWC